MSDATAPATDATPGDEAPDVRKPGKVTAFRPRSTAFRLGLGESAERRLNGLLAYAEARGGLSWRCLGPCSEQLTGERPADGWCDTCRSRRRAAAATLDREGMLRLAGVPKRSRQPFVEPGQLGSFQPEGWPVVEHREGLRLDAWRPGTWWCAFLRGPAGTGKSMLLAELLHRAMLAGHRGLWLRASTIASMVLSGDGVEELMAPGLVIVLDELGVGHEAPAAWAAVEDFVCRRWEEAEPTLVTTNLAAKVLHARSAPLVDRLRDGLCCRLVGESHRGKP
jgi:hypothetical protein